MFLVESVETPAVGSVGTLAEILYEAEVSYGNIVRRMMTIEHKAIITEDADLLKEGAGAYFETFKAWVKKWFAKIKAFFAHVWDRITELFTTDEKWIAEFKKKSFGEAKDVSVYPTVKSGAVVENLKKVAEKLEANPGTWSKGEKGDTGYAAKAKADVIAHFKTSGSEDESLSEVIKKFIFGGNETEKETVSAGAFVAHFEALLTAGKGVKNLRKGLDKAEAECVKAANKAEGDGREEAEYRKAAAMNLSTAMSAYTSALGTARSQIKSILFAGSAANRKDEVKSIHGESALFAGVL
jgi:hypothetical protein